MRNQSMRSNSEVRINGYARPLGIGITLFVFGFMLGGCFKSEYTRLVERELGKSIRRDSLFLGMHFGMGRKEFFERCWLLNKEHILTMGTKDSKVLFSLKDSAGLIQIHFYPDFRNDKIYQIPVVFSYQNWAPWNRQTQTDSLQQRIRRLFENWYGPGFIQVERKELGDFALVKVDGNRRILVFRNGETDVKALFTDLSVENEIKKTE